MQMRFIEAPNNFYLGAQVNPDTHEIIEDAAVYYDARDLTTHGVILGMTGSGKTGLGITFLEEAVVDGIPCLIIDPKGDMTNMLLAFPDLKPEYFLPWVDPEDALRNDHTLEEHATTVAEKWSAGLTEWGITNDRIQEYRRASRFSIYTPGSDAGLPLNILQSFAAPTEGWSGNEEILRERISGMVTAILALIGVNAKPVEDKEHVLLSNIFEYNWRHNTDLSMEQLILQVQQPPFGKLGVMDVNSIFAEKDRFKLAQLLNNIIAAPNFQTWLKGEPIHIPSLLFTPEGYPRTTIVYTAHLNDAERQFITTLLLEAVLSWMRSLSGSTSLRALLYIDEVLGMFPPHPYNPPTKEPLMRLLKQARAFGLGVLVGTQNPKDIDYKGLSNAGTWIIGKLQTDNDKERVLEGLDSARDATSALDLQTVDQLLGRLAPREFILHNVHEPNTPILMHTRWTMSYLRGPLNRQQISQLMANQRDNYQQAQEQAPQNQPSQKQAAQGAMPQQPASYSAPQQVGFPAASAPPSAPAYSETDTGRKPGLSQLPPQQPQAQAPSQMPSQPPQQPAPAAPVARPGTPSPQAEDAPPPGFSAAPPSLPSSIYQYYLPTEYTVEQAIRNWESFTRQPAAHVETKKRLLYRPSMLAQTMVRFTHTKTNTSETYTYAFVVPTIPQVPVLDWGQYVSDPFDPSALDLEPFSRAYYADIAQAMSSGSGLKDLQGNLIDWIYYNAALFTYYNPVVKVYSNLNEDRRDFVARVQAVAREQRDQEVDKVAQRYDARLAALEDKYRKKTQMLESQQDMLEARKREEMLTAGESMMQLMKGRAYYTLSRTSRMRRYTNSNQDRVGSIERDLGQITEDFDATQQEMQQALQAVQDKWVNVVQQIDEVRISPLKKDINVMLFGIGWVPYWDVVINSAPVVVPASTSGLAYAQSTEQGGAW